MPDKSKRTGSKDGKPVPDAWVEDKLRQLYDDVAAEPLPQDLLDLLDKIDVGGPKDEEPGKGGGRS
ncbi:MAG: NepR family anti-sigma factor [Zavarzinia sp.]|nr:NepR family anti-sigma factor [Zavarzinia sp.]